MAIFLVNLSKPSLLFLCFLCVTKASNTTLNPGEVLRGDETLVSSLGVFELGFFNPENSPKKYLGIWFKNDKYKKPVWVSNPDTPLLEKTAFLYVRNDGNLVLSDERGIAVIVNAGRAPESNVTACHIRDTGNLVLTEHGKAVWQSFDSPTDTFLPGMKLGWFDLNTGHIRKQFLTSWLTPLDPSKGNFLFGIDSVNHTMFRIWRAADGKYKDVGFWNGEAFEFFFPTRLKDYNFTLVSNENEVYLTFTNLGDRTNPVPSSWFELASNGDIDEAAMFGRDISVWNHSLCETSACLSTLPSACWSGDGFSGTRAAIPSSMSTVFAARLGVSDCEITCKNNCSCTAYAYNDSGNCLLYFGDKSRLRKLSRGNQSVFVRGDSINDSHRRKRRNLLLKILVPISSLLLFIVIFFLYCLRRRKSNRIGIDMNSTSGLRKSVRLFSAIFTSNATLQHNARNVEQIIGDDTHELQLLSFSLISDATDNFSFGNKLGEGGFGPVYKGKLLDREIAVKRLSKTSGQGFEEFKNEVKLISELQHRNLVKLLGCCVHKQERILVYEYMANKSLDSFIFGRRRGKIVDWDQRMRIIEGIAQGILYLHKYSRLRVIHRDLKTSNVLLDVNMNPKISDFGMARICNDNESQGVTRRVVGTYGYMSPEYAMHGHFSTKSDVFSYGVILLEIVSGRKNTSTFEYMNHSLSLIGYAWNLWKDDRGQDLIDPTVANSYRVNELQLCVHIALLCVQENPENRPSMSDVVSILGNEKNVLSVPTQPALSTYMSLDDIDSPRIVRKPSQVNVSFSALEAR